MTCIVGLVQDEAVWIGGDSAAVAGHSVTIRNDEKVFSNGELVIGFTSSFRMGQLLRYCLAPPVRLEGITDMIYLVAHLIPAMRQVLRDGGELATKDGKDEGGCFLLGYRGGLYRVDDDFQVGVPASGMAAIGSGGEVALGALWALQDSGLAPRKKLERVLGITAELNIGVRPPFLVMGSEQVISSRIFSGGGLWGVS